MLRWRQTHHNDLAECCAGGCRIIAGDMNVAFWSLFPEMADRGVDVRLIAIQGEWNIARANHGERNIALELGQWDSCGLWSSGPMPKPRKSMIHLFLLDGRMENRGAASYNKAYQIPLNEEVFDEVFMLEYGTWLR